MNNSSPKNNNWRKIKNDEVDDLFRTILSLQTTDEAYRYFRDLLTEPEIVDFAKRWQAAQLLDQKVPYEEIERRTSLSSATVSRISHWLNDGTGGYRLMIKRLNR